MLRVAATSRWRANRSGDLELEQHRLIWQSPRVIDTQMRAGRKIAMLGRYCWCNQPGRTEAVQSVIWKIVDRRKVRRPQ